MQRAQGVLLLLVRFNNSTWFEIYRVTRSSSSRPFCPAFNGSTVLQYFEHGNTVKIRNGIIFDFYLGLPHIRTGGLSKSM